MPILATEYPVYQPAMRVISSITNAKKAVITTTFNHQYTTGMIMRLNIPQGFGMPQANTKYGKIEVTSPTEFIIDLDTEFFDKFTPPTSFPENQQYAQVTPMGEVNEMLTAATKNVLPY